MAGPRGDVVAVCRDAVHAFSKPIQHSIELVAGIGVAGDAHAGMRVQHRSRVRVDPMQLNLRQVHLIHVELHDELRRAGMELAPGQMGENITTRGLDLLGFPRGTRLHVGTGAIIEVTGLRNPCRQLDDLHAGLMRAVIARDDEGRVMRKAGIMGIVRAGGTVRPHDRIEVQLPGGPHRSLQPV